jgi:hypothetical protein
MSHINVEPMQFPWVPILITGSTVVLLYLIARWFVEYGLYLWSTMKQLRGGAAAPPKKKKLPPRKRRGVDEEEEEEEEEEEDE